MDEELAKARKLLLDAHKEWVESMGERGKRLDLSGENLSGANFAGVDFSGADLSGRARFVMANMSDADIRGARFSGVVLGEADLSGATFRKGDAERKYPSPNGWEKTLDKRAKRGPQLLK